MFLLLVYTCSCMYMQVWRYVHHHTTILCAHKSCHSLQIQEEFLWVLHNSWSIWWPTGNCICWHTHQLLWCGYNWYLDPIRKHYWFHSSSVQLSDNRQELKPQRGGNTHIPVYSGEKVIGVFGAVNQARYITQLSILKLTSENIAQIYGPFGVDFGNDTFVVFGEIKSMFGYHTTYLSAIGFYYKPWWAYCFQVPCWNTCTCTLHVHNYTCTCTSCPLKLGYSIAHSIQMLELINVNSTLLTVLYAHKHIHCTYMYKCIQV